MADRYYLTKQLTMKAITLPSSPNVINKRLPDEYYQLTKNFNKSSRYNNSIYWVAIERDWRWLIVYELLWTPVLGLDIRRANQWNSLVEGKRRVFCKNKRERDETMRNENGHFFASSPILSIIIEVLKYFSPLTHLPPVTPASWCNFRIRVNEHTNGFQHNSYFRIRKDNVSAARKVKIPLNRWPVSFFGWYAPSGQLTMAANSPKVV